MSDPMTTAVPADLEVGSVYGGDHLKAADIPAGKTFNLKVEGVTLEEMPARDGKSGRKKLVLAFVGASKTLVLNNTNAAVMAGALGPKPATWVGASLVLERTTVPFQGQLVPALRVTKVSRGESEPQKTLEPFQATDENKSFLS